MLAGMTASTAVPDSGQHLQHVGAVLVHDMICLLTSICSASQWCTMVDGRVQMTTATVYCSTCAQHICTSSLHYNTSPNLATRDVTANIGCNMQHHTKDMECHVKAACNSRCTQAGRYLLGLFSFFWDVDFIMLDVAGQGCPDVARHTACLLEELGSLGHLHRHQ